MAQMDAPSKVSMKEIGVCSKWSYQKPEMTEQVQKPNFWGQFGVGGMAQPLNYANYVRQPQELPLMEVDRERQLLRDVSL